MCVAGRIEVNGRKVFKYVRLKCKAWGCGDCGPRKAYRLQKAIQAYAVKHQLTRLLTLTLDPSKAPPAEECIPHIRAVWAKLRVYLGRRERRRAKKAITFISILEFHKSGYPHLHVLIDRYIPQSWIRSSWNAVGGGQVVDIRRIYDLHRVSAYLAKYLTKEMILSAPTKVRRYTTSRGVALFKRRKRPSGWWLEDYSIEKLYFWAALAAFSEEFDYDGSIYSFTTQKGVREFTL
jgi:hypothetical protein